MFYRRFKRILYVLSGLMFLPSAVAQTIHTVPTDFATIGAAITAAIDGDFVVVENGVYSGAGNVNLDPMGKALVIRSENGPGSCYIECWKSCKSIYRAKRRIKRNRYQWVYRFGTEFRIHLEAAFSAAAHLP